MLARRTLVPLAASALMLSACSGSDDEAVESSTTLPPAPEAAELTLLSPDTLTVCVAEDYAPFSFTDEIGATGFDVELLRTVGFNLGLELAEVPMARDGLGAGPAEGACDIAAGALSAAEVGPDVATTEPYLSSELGAVVPADDAATFGSLDDLSGTTVGVIGGSAAADRLVSDGPADVIVEAYDGSAALAAALAAGDVDAVFDLTFATGSVLAQLGDGFVSAFTLAPENVELVFVAAPGAEDLVAEVDAEIVRLEENGDFEAIAQDWSQP